MRRCRTWARLCTTGTPCRCGDVLRRRYIHLPSLHFTDETSDLVQQHTVGAAAPSGEMSEGVQMVRDLQKLQDDIDTKLHRSEMSLFKNG